MEDYFPKPSQDCLHQKPENPLEIKAQETINVNSKDSEWYPPYLYLEGCEASHTDS